MWRYGLFLAALLAPIIVLGDERDPWIGKLALLRPGAIVLNDGMVVDARLLELPERVDKADKDRVWLRRGWAKKLDLMSPDEALAFSDEQIKAHPNNARMWRLRGLAWIGKREPRNALFSLDEAVRLDSTFAEAFQDRGRIKAIRRDDAGAVDDFATAIRLDPENPLFYHRRAFYRSTKGELEEAMLDCNRVIELDPDWAEAFKLRADVTALRGDHKLAIADYDRAIQKDPKYGLVFHNRASCWIQLQDVDQALNDIEEAIRLDPQNASAYSVRAGCWLLKEEYSKAIEDLSESLRLKPDLATHRRRAMTYNLMAKDRKAVEEYEECCRLYPGEPKPIADQAWLLATSTEAGVRDGKRAIDLATKACEMTDWNDDSMVASLAASYAEEGQWENAIRLQQEAIDKTPLERRGRRQETLRLYENHQPLRFTKQELLNTLKVGLTYTPD